MKNQSLHSLMSELQIRRGAKGYEVVGVEGEVLTYRQLNGVLRHIFMLAAEEIAFMYLDFRLHPHRKVAFFGLDGLFMYTK